MENAESNVQNTVIVDDWDSKRGFGGWGVVRGRDGNRKRVGVARVCACVRVCARVCACVGMAADIRVSPN